jgi:hypothetical protein
MAIVYLHKKLKSGRLDPARFGMQLEDLAWDCIADLFQRNQQNTFVRLQSYFTSLAWENKDDDELLTATRCLVFSKVNQEIYRLHRENDPELGRLIRNLKHEAKYCSDVLLKKNNGAFWICYQQEDETSTTLPVMPPEFLDPHLTARLNGNITIKQILSVLADVLGSQNDYRKSYPLTGFALFIRSAFIRLAANEESESNGHENFTPEELKNIIAHSAKTVKSNMANTYVGKEKVDPGTYNAYFLAINDILVAQFVENDGFDRSYYDHMIRHIEGLTRDDYNRRHRCHLEYLAKLARTELLHNLKKELYG